MADIGETRKDDAVVEASSRESGGLAHMPPASALGRWWQSHWETLGWIVFIGILTVFFPIVVYRTSRMNSNDFWQFYESSRFVLDYGVRAPDSKFLHYLPSVDVAAAVVAWMPVRLAAAAWFGIMVGGWLCLLAAVRRYLLSDCEPAQARQAVLVAGLLMMPLFLDHLCVGAFHILMVWFLVAGLGRVSQNRPWSGGLMLGLAVWIKLLPMVGVGYLVFKRKWFPAALAVVAALAVDFSLSLLAYGPATTWQLHREWWNSEVYATQNRMLTDVDPIDEDRITNQSMMIVMRRLLTHMGHGTEADRAEAIEWGYRVKPNTIGSIDFGGLRPDVAMADLSAAQLQTIYAAFMGLLGLGVLFYWRLPGRDLPPDRWATEIALVSLATLWFSPLVWSYHPTAAVPAMAIVFSRAPRHPRVAQIMAALWIFSLIMMGVPTARALGVTLWMNLLLGVFLLFTTRGACPTLQMTSALPAPKTKPTLEATGCRQA